MIKNNIVAMKKIIIYFVFILLGINSFAQNFNNMGDIIELSGLTYEENIIKDFSFGKKKLIFRNYDLGQKEKNYITKSYNLVYSTNNHLTFLLLDNKESLLCLANEDLCILYDKNSPEPICVGSNFTEFLGFLSDKDIEVSTELIEGDKKYGGSNLCNLTLSSPWVESSHGYGVGDYIVFEPNSSFLYFLNGYVSFEKPYLYTANSRVKKIKISFIDDNNIQPKVVELNDTPNPQKISFGFKTKGKIKMEILDIYPGEKYQDTCINGIIIRKY